MYYFNPNKQIAWIIITEEEVLGQEYKKTISDVDLVQLTLIILMPTIIMAIWILIEMDQWIIFIMLKKQC